MKSSSVRLTQRELALLLEALDSHEYWQLSDEYYRNNGEVMGPGAKAPKARLSIRRCRAMVAKLRSASSRLRWNEEAKAP